jgi:hypothetical protein
MQVEMTIAGFRDDGFRDERFRDDGFRHDDKQLDFMETNANVSVALPENTEWNGPRRFYKEKILSSGSLERSGVYRLSLDWPSGMLNFDRRNGL